VGLENYVDVLGDPDIYTAFLRSLVLVVFAAILPVCIGLLLAALLSRVRIRGMGTYRVLLFLPQTIAMVVVAIAWGWIYSRDGIVNEILRTVGLGGVARRRCGERQGVAHSASLIVLASFGVPGACCGPCGIDHPSSTGDCHECNPLVPSAVPSCLPCP
jgi:ABC-type sugar transport system permease subunit